jgi:RNase H-fold protein (predicted Holliday junction resolvase)
VLGIDYGARRIGLALSDATATLASPWRMLQRPPSEAETLRMLITEIVSLKNERLTSNEAEARLARREKDWRKRKQQLDAVAAAIILQDYLDSRPHPAAGTHDSLD